MFDLAFQKNFAALNSSELKPGRLNGQNDQAMINSRPPQCRSVQN